MRDELLNIQNFLHYHLNKYSKIQLLARQFHCMDKEIGNGQFCYAINPSLPVNKTCPGL